MKNARDINSPQQKFKIWPSNKFLKVFIESESCVLRQMSGKLSYSDRS